MRILEIYKINKKHLNNVRHVRCGLVGTLMGHQSTICHRVIVQQLLGCGYHFTAVKVCMRDSKLVSMEYRRNDTIVHADEKRDIGHTQV